MAKSLLLSTLIISGNLGGALAFSSRLGGSSAIGLMHKAPSVSPTKTKLSSYPPITDDNDNSSTALHKRRAFLSNLVASSLLPILTLTNPSVASARGAVNDKGPIVFGDDDIMSQKEHGTTSMPVQENLRYGKKTKECSNKSSHSFSLSPSLTSSSFLHYHLLLRYTIILPGVSRKLADKISSYNRVFAGK